MDDATKEIFREMITALDGCTVALEAEAEREKRQPSRNGLRQVTAQRRLEAVEKLIERAQDHYDRTSRRPDPFGEAFNSGDGTYRP